VNHIPGPEGVRGRNSDNTLITEKLGWAPNTPLSVGLRKTYDWIKKQIEAEVYLYHYHDIHLLPFHAHTCMVLLIIGSRRWCQS
jgi:hypothetical protein